MAGLCARTALALARRLLHLLRAEDKMGWRPSLASPPAPPRGLRLGPARMADQIMAMCIMGMSGCLAFQHAKYLYFIIRREKNMQISLPIVD